MFPGSTQSQATPFSTGLKSYIGVVADHPALCLLALQKTRL